ncbi:tRNA:m(4)X modification enzyme TRM13 homolog isoform X2 [Siniperca chuatsi]|uniref:tRNA:m(4)X modification enzyme TRM13 homolog isoform X2 n=1 Tax=Siniperca chuatsi TaxID=119488 RepID=UPI001CE06731|nr:tRNA:m(4)X modification enzyme TRM13 homolog isoform X2 [Siniperca chuatsi]
MAAPLPGRCGFFVEKKKRFCKMIVGKGKAFCGEHATMVYYVQNINSGPADGAEAPRQVSLSECSRTQLESLLGRLKTAVTGLQCDVDDSVRSHPVLQEEIDNPKNGDSAHKHLKQQSSILGHLEALRLLGRGRCFVEFGAGRGKLSHWIHEALKTSDHLKTCDDLQLLLVERCSTRFKVDGKHQDVGVQFERLQVDIQHLDLSKVPLLRQKKLPLVGVGKHLCGAATDLALRCLLETPALREETGPPRKRLKTSGPADDPDSGPGPDPGLGPVLGLAVALCCHHRCEWRHYVGQQFFLQRGLGPAEFSAFCRMSSWATCGLRPTNRDRPPQEPTNQRGDDEEHEPAEETDAVNGFLSAAEREQIGRLCKRLIDGGRLDFLKTKGFDGKLTAYVKSHVTLENVLLTAVPSSSS